MVTQVLGIGHPIDGVELKIVDAIYIGSDTKWPRMCPFVTTISLQVDRGIDGNIAVLDIDSEVFNPTIMQ